MDHDLRHGRLRRDAHSLHLPSDQLVTILLIEAIGATDPNLLTDRPGSRLNVEYLPRHVHPRVKCVFVDAHAVLLPLDVVKSVIVAHGYTARGQLVA